VALAERSVLNIVDGGRRSLDLEDLVPWIAAGNEPAVARLHEATSGLLFGLLLLILGDTAKAEEVLMEVYAEVRQHARRFDRNHESLLTWLITIAHRRALEHLCSNSGDQQFAVSVGLGAGHANRFGISKSSHRRLVAATLATLSPTERKMIELAYFSRMTPRAISARLGQSPEAVKTGLKFGIAQLYNLFKNQGFLSEA
jgi:RNA polymerase sigma-70 factor, ECF subfamily